MIGDDLDLLTSRDLLLRSSGYETVSIGSAQCLNARVLSSCDLIVLCHTIADSRDRIIRSIEKINSDVRIVVLSKIFGDADGLLGISPTPADLLRTVHNLLNARNGQIETV